MAPCGRTGCPIGFDHAHVSVSAAFGMPADGVLLAEPAAVQLARVAKDRDDALAGKARANAELAASKQQRWRLEKRVGYLEARHRVGFGPGDARRIFVRRKDPWFNEALVEPPDDGGGWWDADQYGLKLRPEAYAVGGDGLAIVFTGPQLACLPREVYAENWWHVCAQTGLREIGARILYEDPQGEADMVPPTPEAITALPPRRALRRREDMVIRCQGEED